MRWSRSSTRWPGTGPTPTTTALEFAIRAVVAAKYNAVEGAWRVADKALELSGGFGMFKKSELERLFRDCRAGTVPPGELDALTHELLAKMTLGIDPDEQPRWG